MNKKMHHQLGLQFGQLLMNGGNLHAPAPQTGTCRCAYESSAASVGGSSSRGSGSGRNIGAAVSGACGMDETPTGTLDDVVAGLKPGKKNKPTKGRLGSLFVRKEKKDSPPCKMA